MTKPTLDGSPTTYPNDAPSPTDVAVQEFLDRQRTPTPLPDNTSDDPVPTSSGDLFSTGDVPEQTLPTFESPDGPGFGPIIPDTTQGVTADDSPGQLFTEENMGVDRTGDFLQQYADAAPGVTPEQTVQGQLEQILNKDNALFDWARGQAAQYSNSRGLLNSDIAAEASSQSVMGVALPIAQQDAETYARAAEQQRQFWHTAGLQAFDATIQSGLMAQDHLERMVEMSHQGDINSRLQLEQFGYNWQLNEQQNIHVKQQMALQGDINARLALQQFGFDTELMRQDYGYRVRLSEIELENALSVSQQDHSQWLERIAAGHANTLAEIEASGNIQTSQQDAAFSRDLQQNYLNAAERRTLQFSSEVTSIYSQTGLTAAQQANAVQVARNNYENDLNMLASYYQSSPYWDPGWIVNPAGTPSAPDRTNEPTANVVDPTPTPIPYVNDDRVAIRSSYLNDREYTTRTR